MIDDWWLMFDDWWLRIEDWWLMIDVDLGPKIYPENVCQKNPHGWSHFRCQVNVFDTYWVVYPSSKEVSPKVRALRAMTRSDASPYADQKIIAPPKPHFFWKIRKFSQKKIQKKVFSVEKWKIANRLKRVLPKFRADPSFVRGVNGRSKFRNSRADFRKRNVRFKNWYPGTGS